MTAARAQVHYDILPHDPAGHVFAVCCRIAAPDPAGQILSLPAWTPGSYLVRDFSGHVITLTASDDNAPVATVKTDKATWRCAPCAGALEVRYQVYARDLSVRGAHLDSTHGAYNGPCLYLRVHGHESERCTVALQRPAGARYADWRLATAMAPLAAAADGFGLYAAADYDELIDHPVEMGTFETRSFMVHGVPHRLVVTGRQHADLERITADLTKICGYQMELFGLPAPVDRYDFLLTVLGDGYGGLEHRWSSSLMARRTDLARYGAAEMTDEYCTFLGLCSHEYFHLWNVRRIRPAPIAQSDLTAEAYTRQLWIFEGITSYYDDLALYRSGVIDAERYLGLLAKTATAVLSGGGRAAQSLADASFDAWVKFYKRDENAPNHQISYYTKGALAALGLDLTIRARTGGARSLDDVMRVVWSDYGSTATPLPEDRFEALAAEVAGVALQDYFDRVVRGVDDPPLAELLAGVGLQMQRLPRRDGESRPAAKPEPDARPAALHVGLRNAEDRAVLTTVHRGGAAHRAGLACGDELVAFDGVRVRHSSYPTLLARYRPGDSVAVDVFRRDELLRFEVELDRAPDDAIRIVADDAADDDARAARQHWLAGSTG